MQNQLTRNTTQSINQTQSLAAVQTLLRAGLGTITYLRNLLPEDNFTRCHFTSIDDSGSQMDASQESTSSRTNVSGFRITTITRGYTDEADRILNYMEYGIFDALEKRYLRSFIFGIYLDTKDPTNIVEAYTFNFKYHKVPGSDIFIPVMSLADMQKKNTEDPLETAIKKGKPPTLKDVKMSVKALLKTLIQAISNMDVLPRRRFATFKVFYTEETPIEYEPPHFEPGDAEKDKWFFMTHDLDEVPERTSIGKIDTGHHSVNLNVTSIASYLPSSTERGDDATFSGLTTNPVRLNLTPIEEAAICKSQMEKQLEDAKNRNLLWPVEDVVELGDLDAVGEDDPDYIRLPDGSFQLLEGISPIGIRNESGSIDAVPTREETEEAQFGGISESAPKHLREMATEIVQVNTAFEETQPLMLTPKGNNLETQLPPVAVPEKTSMPLEEQIVGKVIRSDTSTNSEVNGDKEYLCDCGIHSAGEEWCHCEGGCKKWFHICYHTIDDPHMPSKFTCFDCRLRQDRHWDLIRVSDIHPKMISKFKSIVIFRRAIKVAQSLRSFTSLQYSAEFDYVLRESIGLDDMGLKIATRSKKGKAGGNLTAKGKNRKNIQKLRYVFNQEIQSKPCFLNYFKPNDAEVEARLLGLSEMASSFFTF
ncbi:HORMA domain-containing protein [Pholiota molesta]|nr:HORMA domain-containing protein [Pholiota molesta]